jgi:hypothetical protein
LNYQPQVDNHTLDIVLQQVEIKHLFQQIMIMILLNSQTVLQTGTLISLPITQLMDQVGNKK